MSDVLKSLRSSIRKHPLRDDLRKCAPKLFTALAEPAPDLRDVSSVIESSCANATQSKDTADVFRGWMEIHDGRAWVRREHRELATAAIMDAQGKLSSRIWSMAFVHEPGERSALVSAIIEGLLDQKQIAQLVSAAIVELRRCGERELVFRPKHDGSLTMSRESFRVVSSMEMLRNFQRSGGYDILHYETRDAIVRLVDFIAQISPNSAPRLIGASDHPVLFALATQTFGHQLRRDGMSLMLDWISADHHPSVVAAGLHEILESVNFVNATAAAEVAAQHSDHAQEARSAGFTKSDQLIAEMVAKLGTLHESQFGEHAGALFSLAEYILHRGRDGASDRLTLLRDSLEEQSAIVLQRAASPSVVVDGLLKGMIIPPRETTMRHLDGIAQRVEIAGRSELSAQLYLNLKADYERQIEEHRGKHFFVGYDDEGVAWTNALGRSIAMLARNGALDVCTWFDDLLRTFALELWDYEDDNERFDHDLRIALHAFSVCAVSAMHLRSFGALELSSRLANAIVQAFLPLHEMLHGFRAHTTDTHERFAAPTVVAMMVEMNEHMDAVRSILHAQYTSVDVLASVLRRCQSDDLRGLARGRLEARFDALRGMHSRDARWWLLQWCDLDDFSRAITASLSYSEDFHHDREIGWSLLDVILRAFEQTAEPRPAGDVVATIRGVADSLWGLWCPPSEAARRDETRRRLAALGISCI